ncbi:MAG: RluA family pseudouridine synthase [Gemmatales bacterium]
MSSNPKTFGIEVLFKDDDCLFVNKPSGVLTQAPPGIDSIERRIKSYLKSADSYLGVPHRLDRAASGVMVFAKTPKAARRLAEQFQAKTVEKIYWALVAGKVSEPQGTWIDSMRKVVGVPRAELIPADHPEAKQAILHYITRGQTEAITWLEIHLETGRTHQIRLQAGRRGHPILGDQLYGSNSLFGETHVDERLRAIALHAHKLSLIHPTNRQSMTIEAPPPVSWLPYLDQFHPVT